MNIFTETWPKWLGAVILALLNILLFYYVMPFSGIYPAMANWGVWIYRLAGIEVDAPWGFIQPPHLSIISILTIGLILGGLIGALFSKKFKMRKATPSEYTRSFFGGVFMGVGSLLAGSCIIGGFYSSIMALSLSGFYMLIGLIAGAYIGGHIKPWQKRKVDRGTSGSLNMENTGSIQQKIGIIVVISVLAVIAAYFFKGKSMQGMVAIFGLAFGLVFQRSGFGFSSALRDFFKTQNKEMMRAILISIMVGVIGFTFIKAKALQPQDMLVLPAGLHSIAGGVIFGFGMVMSDG